ncbi:hypothetical protein ACFL16_02070 [Patescibacteria group bacterium]
MNVITAISQLSDVVNDVIWNYEADQSQESVKRIRDAEVYISNSLGLKSDLIQSGISEIVKIFPENIWDEFCSGAGLFQFRTENNKIPLNNPLCVIAGYQISDWVLRFTPQSILKKALLNQRSCNGIGSYTMDVHFPASHCEMATSLQQLGSKHHNAGVAVHSSGFSVKANKMVELSGLSGSILYVKKNRVVAVFNNSSFEGLDVDDGLVEKLSQQDAFLVL